MLTISSIAHVAIRVKDIDRTLDFYINKLGFSEMMRLDKDGRLWLVYLRITDDQYLEVFPEGEGDRAAEREAVGYHHLCLAVPDIQKTVAELDALGIEAHPPDHQGCRQQLADLDRGSGWPPYRADGNGERQPAVRGDRTSQGPT